MSESLPEFQDLPGVSIVICTFNGKKRLKPTLEHALRQIFSNSFEILVVDNASTDGTTEWVKEFAVQSDFDALIRVVKEENPGLSHARLRGVLEAKYSIILFCDDDNWLAENYLEVGYKRFMDTPNLGVLGGEGIPVFESKKPNWFDQFSHSYAVGDLGMKSGILPKGSAVYGAGCFFRKSILDQLFNKNWRSILTDRKGNSLSSGGDVELCYAIQLLGYSVGFEKQLQFQHFLEEARLKWDYYIQLKEGIALSFPLLDIYRYILDGGYEKRVFLKRVQKRLLAIRFAKFKLVILNSIFSNRERKLAERIQKTRWESYYRNKPLLPVYFDHLIHLFSS